MPDPATVKSVIRALGEGLATVAVSPLLAAYHARLLAFVTVAQGLALVPGRAGRLMRRAWYGKTLATCGKALVVDFGAAIRTPKSRVGDNCYIGVGSWFGLVEIGNDFLSGSHVVMLSGGAQHGYMEIDQPMRNQVGSLSPVTVGNDVWVGAHATVMADIASHSVVAAGAVVTRTFSEYAILAGVPARPLGNRLDRASAHGGATA